jgi:hypothetical protein
VRDYDRHDLLGAGFAGYVFGLITACIVAMSAGGCASKNNVAAPKAALAGVVPIAVVSWPSPIRPKCEIPDMPQVPDVMLWKKLTEEEAPYVYVTQRALGELMVWNHDLKTWADAATKCLRLMSESP